MVQMAVSPLPQWFEGSEYTHKVAVCVMKYGPISRITLAQILGLSQGAVSRITSDLIYAGVIEETPMPSGKAGKLPKGFVQKENAERRGRPQMGLRIIKNARSFVGMKINATHISAVAVNAIGQIITGCHDLEIEDTSPHADQTTDDRLFRRGGDGRMAETVRRGNLAGRVCRRQCRSDVRTVHALVAARGAFRYGSRGYRIADRHLQ